MSNRIAAMASVADDAIEQVRYGKEHARWLAALMTAIHRELEPSPALLTARGAHRADREGAKKRATKNPHGAGFLWAFGWFWHHLKTKGGAQGRNRTNRYRPHVCWL